MLWDENVVPSDYYNGESEDALHCAVHSSICAILLIGCNGMSLTDGQTHSGWTLADTRIEFKTTLSLPCVLSHSKSIGCSQIDRIV